MRACVGEFVLRAAIAFASRSISTSLEHNLKYTKKFIHRMIMKIKRKNKNWEESGAMTREEEPITRQNARTKVSNIPFGYAYIAVLFTRG